MFVYEQNVATIINNLLNINDISVYSLQPTLIIANRKHNSSRQTLMPPYNYYIVL